MDWLLLRGLLNARLYPHKVIVKSSRLNGKLLFQVAGYGVFLFYTIYLMLSPARGSTVEAAPNDQDYFGTAAYLVTQTHLATFTPSTSTITTTTTITPTMNGTPFLSFPFVTHLGDFYLSEHTFLFSYYFPDLGGVNCHIDNWENGRCKDTTASGMSWRNNMRKGLAIHPDFLELLPYGTVIRITSPAAVAGDYMVLDLCGGCNINGYYYFDFLFEEMPIGMNWSDPVTFQVLRVGFLNLHATQTLTPVYDYLPTLTSTPTLLISTDTPAPVVIPSHTPTATETAIPTETPTATLELVP